MKKNMDFESIVREFNFSKFIKEYFPKFYNKTYVQRSRKALAGIVICDEILDESEGIKY